MAPQSTLIWNYYENKNKDGKRKCKYCDQKEDNATNAEKHTRCNHEAKFKNYEVEKTKSPSRKRTIESVPTLKLPKLWKTKLADELQKDEIKAFLYLSKPTIPLDSFGDQHLKPLLKSDLKLPTSKGGAKSALHRTAEIVKEKIREKFQLSEHVSIIVDIWSDCSHSSYLGITAHIVNNDFSIDSFFIGLKKLEERHNASYVQKVTEELLSTVGLLISTVNVIITDNGSNMIAAFKEFIERTTVTMNAILDNECDSDDDEDSESEDNNEMEFNWITSRRVSCIDHSLVRSLTKVLNPTLKNGKYSKIIKEVKIHKSPDANQELFEQCGKILLFLLSTRWAGVIIMINRSLEIWKEVNKVCASRGWPTLPEDQISKLQQLSKLLTPFLNAINEFQAEKSVISSLVYGKLNRLLFNCDKIPDDSFVFDAAQLIKSDMEVRFNKFLNHEDEDFNPHFVLRALLSPSTAFDILKVPKDILLAILSEELKKVETPADEFPNDLPELDGTKDKDDSFERYQEELRKAQASEDLSSPENSLAKSYINLVFSSRRLKANDYWPITGINDYPSIYSIALKFLGCPVTSAPIERIFSLAGMATRTYKNRTQETLLNDRLLIYMNRKLFD